MTWVTWRQARLEMLLGLGALAAIAVILLWSGHDAHAAYHNAGLPACVASKSGSDECWSSASDFIRKYSGLGGIPTWLEFLPLLWGILLAAPALLDLEQGTYRLAWTQSVTRGRWLSSKIIVGIGASVIASSVFLELWTWWRGPVDALQGRFDISSFDFEGVAPIAYTIFAFALCLTAGVLLRRAIPAIGISLVGYLVTRILVEDKLRPHYLSPLTITWKPTDPTPAAAIPKFANGDWIITQQMMKMVQGAIPPGAKAVGPAPTCLTAGDSSAVNACFAAQGLMNKIVYQPAHRFWLFQGIEAGIFLGIAALLLGVTVWWINRRVA